MANFADVSAISALAAAFLGALVLRKQRTRTRCGTFLRPLGNLETLITAMHEQGMGGTLQLTPFTVGSSIDPEAIATAVIEAVEKLKASHALLNATIRKRHLHGDGRLWFVRLPLAPRGHNVDVERGVSPERWHQFAESAGSEIPIVMGGELGLLWHVRVMLADDPHKQPHFLAVRYHHSIGDGGTCMQLTHELLSEMADLLFAQTNGASSSDHQPVPPTVEQMVAHLSPPETATPAIHVPKSTPRAGYSFGPDCELTPGVVAPLSSRLQRLRMTVLSRVATARLRKRSKELGVTVHHMISGALLLAYEEAHAHTHGRSYVDIYHNVALRRRLGSKPHPKAQATGLCLGGVATKHVVKEGVSFDALSAQCGAEIRAQLNGRQHLNCMKKPKSLLGGKAFIEGPTAGRLLHLGISNRGLSTVDSSYGDGRLRVLSLCFFSSLMSMGNMMSMNCVTHGGRLGITFAWIHPLMESVHAEKMVERVMSLLGSDESESTSCFGKLLD